MNYRLITTLTIFLFLGLSHPGWAQEGNKNSSSEEDSEKVLAELLSTLSLQLKSRKPSRRADAVESLARLRSRAAPVVPTLLQVLEREELAKLQTSIIDALLVIAPRDDRVAVALAKHLKEGDVHLHREAARGLEKMGDRAIAAWPQLEKIMVAKDWKRGEKALDILVNTGHSRAVLVLQKAMNRTNLPGKVNRAAALGLGKIGLPKARPVVGELVKKVQGKDVPMALAAAEALVNMGIKSDEVTKSMIRLLAIENKELVVSVTSVLEKMGSKGRGASTSLIKGLGKYKGKTRQYILRALIKVEDRPDKVVSILARELGKDDLDRFVKLAIIKRLRTFKPRHIKETIPALVEIYAKERKFLSHPAYLTLNRMGGEIVPPLIPHLKDKRTGFRRQVAQLIEKRSSVLLAPQLRRLSRSLYQRDMMTRYYVRKAMIKVGPKVIPEAIRILEAGNSRARNEAAQILYHYASRAEKAAPQLVGMMGRENTRYYAVRVLEKMGKKAVPHLTKGLTHYRVGVRKESARLLGQLGKKALPAVKALIERLADSDIMVRIYARRALVKIGLPAIPALEKALGHENKLVKKGALEALGEIKGR